MHPQAKKPRIIRQKKQIFFNEDEEVKKASKERREMDEDITNVVVVNGVMLPIKRIEMQGIGKAQENLEMIGSVIETPYDDLIQPSTSARKGRVTHLPGIADEVEAYPCRFCENGIFLTGEGLMRHTKEIHGQDHIVETIVHIQTISSEWRRREKEHDKGRERVLMQRLRQEAVTQAAIRQVKINNMLGGEYQPMPITSADKFESCQTCGLLINQRHPTAIENHLRAHKKNDELREQMLRDYGAELVRRLSCKECHLVFTDEFKLLNHNETMHVRKRKYTCKWCGHVCLSVSELNAHKTDVHGVNLLRNSSSLNTNRNLFYESVPLGIQNPTMHQFFGSYGSRSSAPICRTVCDVCGLLMVRPSLLIRHMLRVHNKSQFEATIQFRDSLSYNVKVDSGHVTWICCQQEFADRDAFSEHRRSHIPSTSETQNHNQPMSEDQQLENPPTESQLIDFNSINNAETIHGELVAGPDGSMQVIVSEPMDSSQVYTLVMLSDEADEAESKGVMLQDASLYDETLSTLDQQNYFIEAHDSIAIQHEDNTFINKEDQEIESNDVVTFTEEEWNDLQMQYQGNIPPLLVKRDDGEMVPARIVVVRDENAIN
ncbi:unnamed protein product, partial [Mesorhabditis belari]|uniref:C2H2-type domain-containing protein n=1 Tax=Mesorhabditis belari TaxID=2138241 RepID=A0AAF3EXV8_9BILA